MEYYKIVYSEELIPYSWIIPSDDFTATAEVIGYWTLQICPIEDVRRLIPDYNYQVTGNDYMLWRPFIPADEGTEVGNFKDFRMFPTAEEFFFDTFFWCLIPCTLDEETGELVEDLTFFDQS